MLRINQVWGKLCKGKGVTRGQKSDWPLLSPSLVAVGEDQGAKRPFPEEVEKQVQKCLVKTS